MFDVATASTEVGASSARLKKIATIADLLRRAGEQGDAKLVAVVVSWLSGELPQRQIGVGWAALRSLPPAATEPSLTVLDVDARFSEIGKVAGKGSQARRAELVTGLFSQATDAEQTFLRRLLGGELRQGALLGRDGRRGRQGGRRTRPRRCGARPCSAATCPPSRPPR